MADTSRKTEQELADEFYMMVGQCISQWAITQQEMFFLCQTVLRGTLEHAAIIFYRTPSIEARLTLANDLVGSVIPKPKRTGEHPHADRKRWVDIEKDCRKLIEVRNRIAHEPVWPSF